MLVPKKTFDAVANTNIGVSVKSRRKLKDLSIDMKDYFEFKGVKYGVGTIVKVPTTTDLRWLPKDELVKEAKFVGKSTFVFIPTTRFVVLYDGLGHFRGEYEEYIEIINPVYYKEPEPPEKPNIFFRTGSGTWNAHNEVCFGFVVYIVIMLITTLFKARIGLWIVETIAYFAWKAKK